MQEEIITFTVVRDIRDGFIYFLDPGKTIDQLKIPAEEIAHYTVII